MKRKLLKSSLLLGLSLTLYAPAKASVLWDGDASHGTGVFKSLNIENQPGEVNVVTDSTYGKVFQFICYDPTTNIKTRTEGSHMAGFQPTAGNTYYFGWRHKWGPLPTECGKWQVLEQIHTEGISGGPVPFGLHVDGCDANMHFQYQDASGTPHDFLVLPFPLNSWHTFVFYQKWSTSESDGFVEFWYDGTHKTLANGSYRYPAAWCVSGATDSYWKWGVYRSGSGSKIGTAYAYLGQAKAGTTYADVDPGGNSGGGGGIDTSAIYQIQNEASSLVLNQQGSLTNGSKITQWSSASTSQNLQWKFIATDSGYYQINSVKSGRDAVVQSASTSSGAGIIQWSFGSAQNDQWKPTLNSDGSYTFVNRHSGLVLEDPGSSTSTSTQMDQWTSNGGANQKWQLLKQ
jgi:hypothetical protein